MMIDDLAQQIRQAIEDAAGGAQPEPETYYHKGDVYLSYGLRAPEFWKIMKAFRPRFLALAPAERKRLAKDLLAAHIGELGHAGIHILSLGANEMGPGQFPQLGLCLAVQEF